MTNTLQKNIMRRVYYSYAVSFLVSPALWQGAVLGACVALFGRLTHVASIWNNLSHTALSNVPNYIAQAFIKAFAGGEVLTVLVVLGMVSITLSFLKQTLPLLLLKPASV